MEDILKWAQPIAIFIVAIVIAWEKSKRWYYGKNGKDRRKPAIDSRSSQDNSVAHYVPGKAKACIEQGKDMVEMGVEIKNLKSIFKVADMKNEKDHEEMFRILRRN